MRQQRASKSEEPQQVSITMWARRPAVAHTARSQSSGRFAPLLYTALGTFIAVGLFCLASWGADDGSVASWPRQLMGGPCNCSATACSLSAELKAQPAQGRTQPSEQLERERKQWEQQQQEKLVAEREQWQKQQQEQLETERQKWQKQQQEQLQKEKEQWQKQSSEKLEKEREQWQKQQQEQLKKEQEQWQKQQQEQLEKERQQWKQQQQEELTKARREWEKQQQAKAQQDKQVSRAQGVPHSTWPPLVVVAMRL
jgi:hypothetical protein